MYVYICRDHAHLGICVSVWTENERERRKERGKDRESVLYHLMNCSESSNENLWLYFSVALLPESSEPNLIYGLSNYVSVLVLFFSPYFLYIVKKIYIHLLYIYVCVYIYIYICVFILVYKCIYIYIYNF